MKDENNPNWEEPPADLADELGNGSLWLHVGHITKPIFLGLQIHHEDLSAILTALDVPEDWWEGAELPHEDVYSNGIRLQKRLAEHLPDYPLLSRICDMYQHAKYDQEEVANLRRECERAQATASENAMAVQGLRKLIYACDRALAFPSRLDLVCD